MLARIALLLGLVASASAFVAAPASRVAASRAGAVVMGPNDKCVRHTRTRHGGQRLGAHCRRRRLSRSLRLRLASRPHRSNNTPAKSAPAGPFGGFKKPGTTSGWLGDNSKSLQIKKFEEGSDYLFFQGPAPKTAVQEDLPSFLSPATLTEAEFQGPLQIVVTLTGLGSFAALAYLLVTG